MNFNKTQRQLEKLKQQNQQSQGDQDGGGDQDTMSKRQSMPRPQSGFHADPSGLGRNFRKRQLGGKDVIYKRSEPQSKWEKQLAKMNDYVMILKGIEGDRRAYDTIRKFDQIHKWFKKHVWDEDGEVEKALGSSVIKAMDTTTGGEGQEWVPTGFSAEILDLIRLERDIPRIVPRQPLDVGKQERDQLTSDFQAYRAPEKTSDNASDISMSEMGTADVTFDTRTLAAGTIRSKQMDARAAIDVAAQVRENLPIAMASALENAIINGVRLTNSSNHPDADVTNDNDPQTLFDGLRQIAQGDDFTDNSNDVDANTLNLSDLNDTEEKMDIFWDPEETVIITSQKGFQKMKRITDEDNNRVMELNPNNPTFEGAKGEISGLSVFTSKFVKNDLDSNGIRPSTPGSKTEFLLWRTNATEVGDLEQMSIEQDSLTASHQELVVAFQYLDFKQVRKSEGSGSPVAIGRNIDTA